MLYLFPQADKRSKQEEKNYARSCDMRITVLILIMFMVFIGFVNAEELPTIAVVDFTSSEDTELATKIPEILTDELVNSGKFNVVERTRLKNVLLEQGFQSSASVNIETAIEIGKMLGARYLMTGHIIDFGSEIRRFDGYGASAQTTFYRLKVSVRVIDTKTGRIIFSTKKHAEEKEYGSRTMQIEDSALVIKLAENISGKIMETLLTSSAFGQNESGSKEMVKITVTSEPKGADVEINGVFYGNAGSTFKVPAGLHTVTVGLPGYEVWHKKVMFRDGLKFHAKLMERKDAKIEIDLKR